MKDRRHMFALLQALLVTFLWSTSFVLIKYAITDAPVITFAGLRYVLAAGILLFYMAITGKIKEFKQLTKKHWIRLISLGLVMYFLTQGTQYLGLSYLPAIQVSVILNFTPVVILIFSSRMIKEKPTQNNIIGVAVFMVGALIYFIPLDSVAGAPIGYVFMLIGLLSNAGATMLGRSINKEREMSPVMVTTVSMAIGGVLLLGTGFAVEGVAPISPNIWLISAILALVNTAFAFSLWNKTMQTLTSVESSIINNTMLIQIAILAWLFLDESFTLKSVLSVVVISIGVFLVQYRSKKSKAIVE